MARIITAENVTHEKQENADKLFQNRLFPFGDLESPIIVFSGVRGLRELIEMKILTERDQKLEKPEGR